MPIILFSCLTSSTKYICICNSDTCKDSCPTDSLLIDSKTNSFYKNVANFIERDKEIIVFTGSSNRDNDLTVDIRLSLFVDRQLRITTLNGMFQPRNITIIIDLNINYEFTSLDIEPNNIILQFLGSGGDNIKMDKLGLDCNLMNPNTDFGIYSLEVNTLKISAESIIFFKTVSILNNPIVHVLARNPYQYFFSLHKNKISVLFNNINMNISTKDRAGLFIEGDPRQFRCSIHLEVGDDISPSDVPSININNVANIFLLGDWNDVPLDNHISGDFFSVYPASNYLPFNLNAMDVNLFIDRNITVPTKTNSFSINVQAIVQGDVKFEIYFKYITCELDVKDARIDVIVDIYDFAVNTPMYPVTFTVSDTTMTHITVNEPRFYQNMFGAFEVIKFRVLFKNAKTIDDVRWLLDDSNKIMTYPKDIDVLYYMFYRIAYRPESSLNIAHVRQLDNSLHFKTTVSGNLRYMSLSFHNYTEYQDYVLICNGVCPIGAPILLNVTDINESGIFESYIYNRYEILINYTQTDTTVGLQNIMHNNVSYVITGNHSNVHIICRESIDAINVLDLINCRLIGDVNLYAHNTVLSDCHVIDDDARVNIHSNIVSVDQSSFDMIRRSSEPIGNLLVKISEMMSKIKLFNDGIEILGDKLSWNRFYVLTLSMFNGMIENNIVGKISGFNIVLNSNSDIILTGDWSQCIMMNGLNINLNFSIMNLVLTKPYYPQNLRIIGPGSYRIILDYDDANICVYSENSNLCFENDVKMSYEQFLNVSNFEATKLTIHFAGFDEDNIPEVNLSTFSSSNVRFISNSPMRQSISIIPSDNIELQLSRFRFEGMLIHIDNSTENETDLVFSTLELINSNFVSEQFRQMKLVVSTLICDFSNLAEFKDIVLLKEIELSGRFIEDKKVIMMPNKQYSEVLKMTISGENKLIYGNFTIKAGGVTFQFLTNFPRSLVITLLPDTSLTYECLEGTVYAIDTFMFSPAKSSVFFRGSWFNVMHYFFHEFHDLLSLHLNGVFRYGVSAYAILDVYATTENIVLIEPLVFNEFPIIDGLEILIAFYSELDPDTPITFIVQNFISFIRRPLGQMFDLENSTIFVRVINTQVFESFSVSNTLSKNRCSSIIFENDYLFFFLKYVFIFCEITGPLEDFSEYLAFRENITLVTTTTNLLRDQIEPIFAIIPGLTHGFQQIPMGCFAVRIDIEPPHIKYVLYPVVTPDKIPYSIYTNNINEAAFKISQITKYIEKVNITTMFQMTLEQFLPLSKISNNDTKVQLNVTGVFKEFFCDSIGSSVNELILNNLVVCQDDLFSSDLERLKLQYVRFNVRSMRPTDIEDVEYDFSTFIDLQRINSLQPHYKKLRITNVHYVTFTEDSFIFGSDSNIKSLPLRKESVETLEIMTTCSINLDLANPTDQMTIRGLRVLISSCDKDTDAYVIIGEGWDKVVNIRDIEILAEVTTSIVVASPIYPVPVMNVNKPYATIFNPLASSLLISDKSPITQDLFMNIPSDTDSHYIVNANNIVVGRSTTIKCDFNATINLNTLDVKDSSNATLYSSYIKKNIKTEPGAYTSMYQTSMASSSLIEIHWSKDRWPSIHLDLNDKDDVPSQIKIILDDTEIDYDEYHLYTYRKEYKIIQGNFDCNLIMKNIQFNSTDKYFADSSDLIFSAECIKGSKSNIVSIKGERELPIDKAVVGEEKGLKAPSIISIVVAVIIVLCIGVGIAVFYVSRKKFIKILNEQKAMKKKKANTKKRLNHNVKENEVEEEESISLKDISDHKNESEVDSSNDEA